MRVLHLPQNIASIPSHTVRSLRQRGIEASGLVISNPQLQSSEGLKVQRMASKPVWRRTLDQFAWFIRMASLSASADLLHWYYGRPVLLGGFDLTWLGWLRKPALVEWMGSDIRQPDIESADNSYYQRVYTSGDDKNQPYEYAASESRQASLHAQRRFAAAGFAAAADRGLFQYIDRQVFPQPYLLPRRLILDDYPETYPDVNVRCPIVVHSPSAPVAKGTHTVLRAVQQVLGQPSGDANAYREKEPAFEFRLLQALPRAQVLAQVQAADIVLDQFVLGDFGMAALEAMACGKPVICYIKPALAAAYGPDLPVVNATQENLAEALQALLGDPKRRRELGCLGREYVAKKADLKLIAPQLLEIYQELISSRRRQHG